MMPEEFLGKGKLTYEERALLVATQLYAVGQQGSGKVQNDEGHSVGGSLQEIRLACLKNEQSTASIDRRINAMLTASTFDEFVYHLRQNIKIGKARSSFTMNFPALASDLYWYQNGRDKEICLKWARDYYRPLSKKQSDTSEQKTMVDCKLKLDS